MNTILERNTILGSGENLGDDEEEHGGVMQTAALVVFVKDR